ncbi:dihydrofolate reductase family protein [uncultured Dietzia sp.]|uniref:dihydrofolate reductase family protein n=1 Tax=uncultured Dietzia sp. TaxID=395519 RepID=UPI0025FEC9A9|nr:dihydrofolate reductase family protein [uncultured Dietzia sp.]
MSRVRIHNMFVSLDGFAAGTYVTTDHPIGDAAALFAGFDGRVIHGIDGEDAPITLDRALTSLWGQGIGAEIMGRRKFGPQSGPWDDDGWRGWWGDEPPFRTPVIVLTHHAREPIEFANGTVFHFLDAAPAEALQRARELAPGTDVRIGGGPTVCRQFLEADLVDFMHVVVVPVVLGEGERAFPHGAALTDRFDVEVVSTPGGRTHQLWNRRAREM